MTNYFHTGPPVCFVVKEVYPSADKLDTSLPMIVVARCSAVTHVIAAMSLKFWNANFGHGIKRHCLIHSLAPIASSMTSRYVRKLHPNNIMGYID